MKGGFDMDNNRHDEFERKYGDAGAASENMAPHAAGEKVTGAAQHVSGEGTPFAMNTQSGGAPDFQGTPGMQGAEAQRQQSPQAAPNQHAEQDGQSTQWTQSSQGGVNNPQGAQRPYSAPDGTYSMSRPANGTTYFRSPQEGNAQRGEWSSNSTSSYSTAQGDTWQGSAQYPPRPPYADQPHFGQRPNGDFMPPHPADDARKKKKDRKGISAGAAAILCAVCVVASGAFGYLGAAAAMRDGNGSASAGNSSVASGDRTTVLYRSVSTDADAKNEASLKDVITSVENSVVEITTEFKSAGYFQYVSSGAGSGVVISEDGYIVTNNHVIMNEGKVADSVMVRMKDGATYEAKLVGRDADTDIAVIKIEASGLSAAVFGDSDSLYVGQDIVAIGNPLGELGGTVTEGIISALDREVDVEGVKMNLLQISAAVNPGNSGGGLFNMKGELVGIVNAKSSGSGIEGLGFAIPSADAQRVATELMTNGYVTGKPYLGISFYYAGDELTAYRYFGSQAPGLYVYQTIEGYNDSVLKPRDRVVEINGKEIVSQDDVVQILKESKIGDALNFIVYRDGKRTELEVKVYEYVPSDDSVNFES